MSDFSLTFLRLDCSEKYSALSVRFKNRSELDGNIERIPNIILNSLMNNPVKWFPNKKIF